jgi:hypothetical protein
MKMLEQAVRTFDVGILADGVNWELVERLFLRFGRALVLKGASENEWAEACGRCRVAVAVAVAGAAPRRAEVARKRGCVPILVEPASTEGEVVRQILSFLSDPDPKPAAFLSTGPLRIVLNHGGLVAQELAASVRWFGWELTSLFDGEHDPLPRADLLIVLPYGDPLGALDAVRRAERLGVPTAFWNVEDPRYYYHPEYGPIVRALAPEASATFSTTYQLAARYRELGVDVHYLPNYGRSYFFVEEPLDDGERSIDLLFLGSSTPERTLFIDRLRKDLGARVTFVARDDVRDPGEIRRLVASARLGLAYGTLTDAPESLGEGLTERVFDYPLAGTPVLSDARAHLGDHFVDGESVFLLDEQAAVTQIRSLLAHPERLRKVAARARSEILRRHLGRHRVLTIVEALRDRGLVDRAKFRPAIAEAHRREGEPRP